ncbi:hypothetical protein ACFYU8_18270 [Brevibacillus sp. NPDC003359]|uniref:hypothetical protein n=1 Tax=unclassified Brevibacillus TaxID=2684853 RepID=UPI00369DA22B
MTTFFNERAALQMNLESLLKMRHSLRVSFAEQDKALSIEIKEIIDRVSKLDQLSVQQTFENGDKHFHNANEEVSTGDLTHQQEEPMTNLPVAKRRSYNSIDYPRITRCLEDIVKKSDGPVPLKEVVSILKKDNIYMSNYYITIQKVLKETENVESLKQGKKLFLVWKNN